MCIPGPAGPVTHEGLALVFLFYSLDMAEAWLVLARKKFPASLCDTQYKVPVSDFALLSLKTHQDLERYGRWVESEQLQVNIMNIRLLY